MGTKQNGDVPQGTTLGINYYFFNIQKNNHTSELSNLFLIG
jgi:hypothetical protein